MESILVWVIVILLILTILVPYIMKIRTTHKSGLERKKEAQALGADRPVAQYPQIDYYRCIGCGACVKACPEGDVLGLVSGKATIINGLRCVGHGLCAEACPVNGLKVGLGDIKSRDDIPVLNTFNETNIPGLYIAGELAGLALIKNAISQGRMVIDKIAEHIKRSDEDSIRDVIIAGAGPAGLSATLAAIQHRLSYLVIDQQEAGGTILQYPRKKLVMTKPVEIPLYGWLKKPEYSKEELLDIWRDAQVKNGINVLNHEKLIDVSRENGFFRVKTQNNSYFSQRVVLALGRRGTPRKLGIPGEDRSKVMYKLLDAETYHNEKILIVGGGDSAVEAAIGLAQQTGNEITISYRKAKFFRIKSRNEERMHELIIANKVNILFDSNVLEILEKTVKIQRESKIIEMDNDYVFIFAGGEPPFELMQKIGIAFGGEFKEGV
jgi:thioredoxin reductase (NADPH)